MNQAQKQRAKDVMAKKLVHAAQRCRKCVKGKVEYTLLVWGAPDERGDVPAVRMGFCEKHMPHALKGLLI